MPGSTGSLSNEEFDDDLNENEYLQNLDHQDYQDLVESRLRDIAKIQNTNSLLRANFELFTRRSLGFFGAFRGDFLCILRIFWSISSGFLN